MSNIQLVHLDSRHTTAAIVLAKEANHRNITVSLDVEKDRTFLSELMPLCDIFFTNQNFPETYYANKMKDSVLYDGQILSSHEDGSSGNSMSFKNPGDSDLLSALLSMTFLFFTDTTADSYQGTQSNLEENPVSTAILKDSTSGSTVVSDRNRAELVVTTRGSSGSLLMRRVYAEKSDEKYRGPLGKPRGNFMFLDKKPIRGIKKSIKEDSSVLSDKNANSRDNLNLSDVGSKLSKNSIDGDKDNEKEKEREKEREMERENERESKNPLRLRGSFMLLGENPMQTTESFQDPLMLMRIGREFEHENPMETTKTTDNVSVPSSSVTKIQINKSKSGSGNFDLRDQIDADTVNVPKAATIFALPNSVSKAKGPIEKNGKTIIFADKLDDTAMKKRSDSTIKEIFNDANDLDDESKKFEYKSGNSINLSLLTEIPLKVDKFIFSRLIKTSNKSERIEFEVTQ